MLKILLRKTGLLCAGLSLALSIQSHAQVQSQATAPATEGYGFIDAAGLAPHAPFVEMAPPVMRPPAVDTLATLRLRGVLRVGVVPVVPMVMRNANGEFSGYSVDIARRLAEDMGVALEFVPTTWGDLIPDLIAQRFDLIASGLWVTTPRALVVNFTQPTATESVHVVASKRQSHKLNNINDVNQPNMTVAVGAGTPEVALAKRLFPRAKLLQVEGEPFGPVLRGQAQVALLATLTPTAIARAVPELYLPFQLPVGSTLAALAVRKGDSDFLSFLNTWIAIQRQAGWLDERLLHWSLAPEPTP
ncbi:transporter substrate-binding domain-containing protein [Roseateles oligotrophus]|uniref:Transporter substrate-binding domain-containing protein n=1 Tax=Roseateles oligotrophus TaxID=1769250 RepID=A0ABT2YM12_9BURK|nr:transporter substrate-binding domain-containing protein [Roseateles oligotrophus]MCV2371084.1 transporter substrate-binding domain-containing protein [Roseateles oligotrophus]